MDEYAKYLIVLGAFFFFVWWYFKKRQNELTASLDDILHEIYRAQFAVLHFRDEAQKNEFMELKNPTMRIRLTRCGATEDLLLERFFAGKEASGANIVQTTLYKNGIRRILIHWKMHHHLMGRTFDIGSGYSFGFQARQLIGAITQEVTKQTLPKE